MENKENNFLAKNEKNITIGLILLACLVIIGFLIFRNTSKIDIKFDSDGGTIINNQTIKIGDKIQKPSDPTKEGYIFDGWYYNDELFDFNTVITKDIEVCAKWIKKSYNVIFKSDDKEVSNDTVEYNNTIDKPNDPTKEGYIFEGWYYNDELFDFNTKITSDLTLEAKWSEKESNLNKQENNFNINSNQGNNNQYTNSNQNNNGENTNNSQNNSNQNTANNNQNNTDNNKEEDNSTDNSKTNYYVEHYLMDKTGNYSTVATETEEFIGIVGNMVSPSPKTYKGYTSPDIQEVSVASDGSTVIKYYYVINKYTLIIQGDKGIEKISGAGTYFYGDNVNINYTIKDGYTLDNISENVIDNIFAMPDSDVVIKIITTPNNNTKYAVKHYKMNLDGKTYTETEIEEKTGTTDTLITPEVKNYEGFTSPEEKTVNIDGNGNALVEYYYTRNKYNLILSYNNGISKVLGSGKYYFEEEIEIDAELLNGYSFDYWISDNGTKYQETKSTIKIGTNDISLVAHAKMNEYSITYDLDGGQVSVPNKSSYTVETEDFKLNPPEKEGYTFIHWILSDGTILKDGIITKGTTGNLNIKAIFTQDVVSKYKIIFNSNNGANETMEQESEYGADAKLNPNEFKKTYLLTYKYNYPNQNDEIIDVDNKFIGWATEANGEVIYKDEDTINISNTNNDTINLYAKWENPIINLKDITRDNYIFGGWSTSTNKEDIISETSYVLTGNKTLTAIWYEIPKIESLSFTVKDSNGKIYNEAVSMGDNAFYIKFPVGSTFDVASLKIKTSIPVTLNPDAIEDSKYLDIKPSSVSDDGMSGKIAISIYTMEVKSDDKVNWSSTSKSQFVSIDTFELALSVLIGKDLGIAKGFGITEEGIETPHYVSVMKTINNETYLFFKEEGTPDINVNFMNKKQEILKTTIPRGSAAPMIGTYDMVGHNFVGWYSDESFNTTYDFSKPLYNDTTIYGKYVSEGIDTSWYDKDATSFNISTLEELKGFAYLSNLSNNTFYKKVINLTSDIDLKNEEWVPISNFSGTFNGNNHTIYNLKITESSSSTVNYAGFFDLLASAKICNLKFENVNINTSSVHSVGTVAGSAAFYTTFEKIAVKNVQITGYSQVGGISGQLGNKSTISEASVTNGQVYAKKINGNGGYDVGGIIAVADGEVSLMNLYSDVTVKADSTTSSLGGILGEYYKSESNLLTVKNVLFTGTISGNTKTTGAIYGRIGTSILGDDNTYDNDQNGNKATWLYDKNKIGLTDSGYLSHGTGKTTDELKRASTYSSFSTDIWNLPNGTSYANLKWLQ